MVHTLLSLSPLAWSVAKPEQQTKADELESPALWWKRDKIISVVKKTSSVVTHSLTSKMKHEIIRKSKLLLIES